LCRQFHHLSQTGCFRLEITKFPSKNFSIPRWSLDLTTQAYTRPGMHDGEDDWLTTSKSCLQLWKVGVHEIFADGSFAEDKDHPNDIDGYFVCDLDRLRSGELTRELNLLDPYKVWTWDPSSRKPYRGYPKKQLPMWHRYRVELYPHFPGMGCGIRDKHGHELEFPAAFRQSRRDGKPRGIVKIK